MTDAAMEPSNLPQDALLACQAVAVCLELYRTCPVMREGGNFKVADIAGNINALMWGRHSITTGSYWPPRMTWWPA